MSLTSLSLGHGPALRWRCSFAASSTTGRRGRAPQRLLVIAKVRARRRPQSDDFGNGRLQSEAGWSESQLGDWGASYNPPKPQPPPAGSKHTILDIIDAGALLGAAGGAAAALITEQLAFAALPLVLPLLSLLASRQRESLRQQVRSAPLLRVCLFNDREACLATASVLIRCRRRTRCSSQSSERR